MLKDLFRNLRDLDQACREYYLRSDVELASISIGAALLLIPPMAFLDYVYYQFSFDFFETVLFEMLFTVFSIGMILIIRRSSQVKTYEQLIFAWTLITSFFATLVTILQPDRVIENSLFCLLFFIANFLTIPNKLIFRIVPAGIIYLAYFAVILTNNTWFTFPSKYMFTLTLLTLSVVGIIVISRSNHSRQAAYALQKEEREARQLYEALAMLDSLTGISNRRYFFEQAEQEWNLYKRYFSVFCIAMIDLDLFKLVNDTYGHAAGDEILRQYASLIKTNTRITDSFARVGGEEFAFLYRKTNQNEAARAIGRIQDAVSLLRMHSPELKGLVTFSAGIAEVQVSDKSFEDTIRRADQAMYLAKEHGRDRIECG